MKKLILTLPLLMMLLACTTTQKQVAYKTLYSVAKSTEAAYSAYNDMVVSGAISPSTLPQVAKAYRSYQTAFLKAVDAAEGDLNQYTPVEVVELSASLVRMIDDLRQLTKGAK